MLNNWFVRGGLIAIVILTLLLGFYQLKSNNLSSELKLANQQNANLQAQISQLKTQNTYYQNQIKINESSISNLAAQIGQKDVENAQLQSNIQKYKTDLAKSITVKRYWVRFLEQSRSNNHTVSKNAGDPLKFGSQATDAQLIPSDQFTSGINDYKTQCEANTLQLWAVLDWYHTTRDNFNAGIQ